MWQCSQHVLTTRDKSCRRPNRKSSTTATTSLNHHRPPPHLHLHQEAINSSPFRKWRLVSFCALPCQQSSALFSPFNSVRPHHPATPITCHTTPLTRSLSHKRTHKHTHKTARRSTTNFAYVPGGRTSSHLSAFAVLMTMIMSTFGFE